MENKEQKELLNQFQILQQQLQSIAIQKENLKLQNLEIEKALEELNATKQKEALKIVGNIMVKKSVEELKKELEKDKEDIAIRIENLGKIEERINNKLKELQTKLK
jgi:prefoldin beta subunit